MRWANRQRRLRRPASLAAGALVLLWPAWAAAKDRGRTVYYQVTYADGTMRELSAVPKTGQGITRVLRVLRVEQGRQGYEILSTGPQALTLVSRGQTYKSDLQWNGKAWVAPEDAPAAAGGKPAPKGADPSAALRAQQAEIARAQAGLVALLQKLLASDEKLGEIEKSLREGREGPSKAAADEVTRARKEIWAALAEIVEAARKLSGSPGAGKPPADASGKVTPGEPAPEQRAGGIVKPVEDVAVLPCRAQVWKLPSAAGQRTYHVSIAHPEAGRFGEFYYVAYADTDGDARPDKLIARSPLARADVPGAWTRWDFATSERDVFVGRAWQRAETAHYHVEAVRVDGLWRDLSAQCYVSSETWGVPLRRWGPCVGNVRVWVDATDPGGRLGRGGRRVSGRRGGEEKTREEGRRAGGR